MIAVCVIGKIAPTSAAGTYLGTSHNPITD